MLLDCQITKIHEAVTGTSKQTGNAYTIVPIEVEWLEQKHKSSGEAFAVEHTLLVELRGAAAQNMSLQAGTYVTIDVRFVTNLFNEKTYNKIYSNYIILRAN